MYTLGIHGGVNTVGRFVASTPRGWLHDAAAVLCKDGKLVAAAEEERFLRIKHVNYFPLSAIRHCLDTGGISLSQVERIELSSYHMNDVLEEMNRWKFGLKSWLVSHSFADLAAATLDAEFADDTRARIHFAGHHRSHALSAVCLSGFSDALCVVLDGFGDGFTGVIASFSGGKLEVMRQIEQRGPAWLYLAGTHVLGYDVFDEYKIMGLAPYGTAGRFRRQFDAAMELKDNGEFAILPAGLQELRCAIDRPGRNGKFSQEQCDFAAGLQCAVERLLFHVLDHFQDVTGHQHLCLAGGFAQNCTSNGKVLTSGRFRDVFVQPVAYDAGCALGAAIHGYLESGAAMESIAMTHLYWGSQTPEADELLPFLHRWSQLVVIHAPENLDDAVASLLANGSVVAWVQGRAEFGARALGNRSILADPRPAANRQRINDMIKKREGFRPFAPSVLEEYLHQYFDVPTNVKSLPYMAFVVNVKENYRAVLGAVTHVDGSARVQSVSKVSNEKYWRVIQAFYEKTGVPLILNTSFNNAHEPIVDSPRDAINCFLSTDLDYLVLGNFLIEKRKDSSLASMMEQLIPQLSRRFSLCSSTPRPGQWEYRVHDRYRDAYRPIARETYSALLAAAEEQVALGLALERLQPENPTAVSQELAQLWCERVFTCDPSPASQALSA